MAKLSLKSFAKVNVGLQILNKRADGLHNINTLFQEIDLYDNIIMRKKKSGCHFITNVKWLKNDKSNLCIQAWEKMQDYFEIDGISINLDKKIPPGSGLGGGSSNAATILKGLRRLYNLDVKDGQLEKLAVEIGADVPFFVKGGLQVGGGVGDQLKQLCGSIKGMILLVIPNLHIDTFWAYKNYNKKILDDAKERVNFPSLLGKQPVPYELFENDFETIVVPAYPEIGKIKEVFRAHRARLTSLSGSGSTVYGIFDNEADLRSAESHFSPTYKTLIANPRSDRI